MSNVNMKLTMVLELHTPREGVTLNKIVEVTRMACKKYGVYEVRKAAISQHRGINSKALEEVGLGSYSREVLTISDLAFSLLTDEEKKEDFDCHFTNHAFKYD